MDQKAILGTLFVIFLVSILFFQQQSNKIGIVLIFGILLGILWFFKK